MVAVQPDTQIVWWIVAWVTAGLSDPGVRAGFGSPGSTPDSGRVAPGMGGGADAAGGAVAPGSSSLSIELVSREFAAGETVGLAVAAVAATLDPVSTGLGDGPLEMTSSELGPAVDTAATGLADAPDPVVEDGDELTRSPPTIRTAAPTESAVRARLLSRPGDTNRRPAYARSNQTGPRTRYNGAASAIATPRPDRPKIPEFAHAALTRETTARVSGMVN
jgi:hypothetical protein